MRSVVGEETAQVGREFFVKEGGKHSR